MDEMQEDAFLTFIPEKETEDQTLDIQQMMLAIVDQGKFTITEFWNMPLNLVLQLLGMFTSPKKKPMSRKTLVDHERRMNILNGY